jgi:hypothetical protein
MPLFGKNAKTYWSTDPLDADNAAADLSWTEVTNIQDLTDNFTSEEVDTTTRATAALGWSSTVQTIKNGEITFTMLMENDDTFVQAMMDAFLTSGTITVLDMTGSKDADGTFGLAANFSVGMTFPKPVKGVQTADVTLKVQSFPEWVEGAA